MSNATSFAMLQQCLGPEVAAAVVKSLAGATQQVIEVRKQHCRTKSNRMITSNGMFIQPTHNPFTRSVRTIRTMIIPEILSRIVFLTFLNPTWVQSSIYLVLTGILVECTRPGIPVTRMSFLIVVGGFRKAAYWLADTTHAPCAVYRYVFVPARTAPGELPIWSTRAPRAATSGLSRWMF